eukprot:jgi/Hompol1/2762/HPOL_003024-RA
MTPSLKARSTLKDLAAPILGFSLLQLLARRFSPDSQTAQKLPSTVNAVLVGSASLYTIVLRYIADPNIDVLTAYPPPTDAIFAIFAGFSLFDSALMLSNNEHPSVWIHHILGFAGTSLERIYRVGSFFPLFFCIPELTVPFSNLVWILQRAGADKIPSRSASAHKSLFAWALWLRMVAFLIFRLPSGPLSLLLGWRMIRRKYERQIRSADEPDSDPSRRIPASQILSMFFSDARKLPLIVSIPMAVNVITFSVLNCYWTALVVKAYRRFITTTSAVGASSIHHI